MSGPSSKSKTKRNLVVASILFLLVGTLAARFLVTEVPTTGAVTLTGYLATKQFDYDDRKRQIVYLKLENPFTLSQKENGTSSEASQTEIGLDVPFSCLFRKCGHRVWFPPFAPNMETLLGKKIKMTGLVWARTTSHQPYPIMMSVQGLDVDCNN